MPTEAGFLPGTQHVVIIPSFIPSPTKYLLSDYYTPRTVLGAENTEVTRQHPARRAYGARLPVFTLDHQLCAVEARPWHVTSGAVEARPWHVTSGAGGGPALACDLRGGAAASHLWEKPTPLTATSCHPLFVLDSDPSEVQNTESNLHHKVKYSLTTYRHSSDRPYNGLRLPHFFNKFSSQVLPG